MATRFNTINRSKNIRRVINKDHPTKQWRPIFSIKRPFEDNLLFEARENIAGFEREGGPLDAFLEDADSSIPSWEMTVIKEFLRTRNQQTGPVPDLARARLDDREYSTRVHRQHPEWLTSGDLRILLNRPVFFPHTYSL
jgi:hypothetical protein